MKETSDSYKVSYFLSNPISLFVIKLSDYFGQIGGNSVQILDLFTENTKIAILLINKYISFIIISDKQYHKTIKLSIKIKLKYIQKTLRLIV